jgi:D-alanyl-D-alanine endopeptidase (penicillin-binding protein 7)
MTALKQHIQPAARTVNWKRALPVIGIAACCFSLNALAADDDPADTDQVTPAVVDFTSCQKPVYPASSVEKQEHGTVNLSFDLDAAGHILGARIEQSSGSPDLDREALGAISKCDFKPATRAGAPVASTGHVQYVWTLD